MNRNINRYWLERFAIVDYEKVCRSNLSRRKKRIVNRFDEINLPKFVTEQGNEN